MRIGLLHDRLKKNKEVKKISGGVVNYSSFYQTIFFYVVTKLSQTFSKIVQYSFSTNILIQSTIIDKVVLVNYDLR